MFFFALFCFFGHKKNSAETFTISALFFDWEYDMKKSISTVFGKPKTTHLFKKSFSTVYYYNPPL